MAERAFARIGYMDDQKKFVPQDIRARDVYDTEGNSVEDHISSSSIHLSAEQVNLIANAIQSSLLGAASGVATLDADGKIPASQLDLAQYTIAANVESYVDMLALTTDQAPVNSYIFVKDATGDPTVEKGWAAYRRVAANVDAGDYVKVAEGESLDINIPDLEQGIDEAKSAAQDAQNTANTALEEAAKLDFAYCVDEADMASKNLRVGAVILMAVENN